MSENPVLAILGGSGLYDMPGFEDSQEFDIDTPFGKPSAPIVVGTLEGQRLAFLARHGIGHHIAPSEINFRANIYALKFLGVERVVSVSACGSLREDYAPGEIVIPDQLFDFTKDRSRTFFEGGMVAHISVADPFCSDLGNDVYNAVKSAGGTIHKGGSLITIEGPRFSTRAESNIFRSWGMSAINMSTAPEAFLAKEAEMCYAVMNHVTDYDVWHVTEEPVNVEMLIATLFQNAELAQEAVRNLARNFKAARDCDCGETLASALITDPKVIPDETKDKLGLLVSKYLRK
ncbi:MAG: S-methyl-5'-thioadenosine phosphorylase [Anaerolineales bacterium]|nr:S-methyl-5'-thioadenosine phosphorylase [Chloroflexota bacterium]MBL6979620.1 S-methyl-5'-thioadenosine phosphorylase [Anaerolineales bacterium]